MTADYDVAVRDHFVDMLYLDGDLAALIEMRPEADHLLIVNVAVAPARQGRGHGRALWRTRKNSPGRSASRKCASTPTAASPRT